MSHSADDVYEALRAYQRENGDALDALEQRLSEQQQVGLAGIGSDVQRLRAEMDHNMEAIKKKFERMMAKVTETIQRPTEQINTRCHCCRGRMVQEVEDRRLMTCWMMVSQIFLIFTLVTPSLKIG